MRVARLTASQGDHPDKGVIGIEQFVGVVFNICAAAPRRPNRRPREVRILIVLPVVNRTFSCLLKKRPPDLASFVASRPMGGSALRPCRIVAICCPLESVADQTGSAGTEQPLNRAQGPLPDPGSPGALVNQSHCWVCHGPAKPPSLATHRHGKCWRACCGITRRMAICDAHCSKSGSTCH